MSRLYLVLWILTFIFHHHISCSQAHERPRFLSHKLSFQENICSFYCEYTASLLMVCIMCLHTQTKSFKTASSLMTALLLLEGSPEREREQQCGLLTVCCYKCLSLLACYTPRCRLTADWAVTLFIMSAAVKALTLSFKKCCQKLSSPPVHFERGALQLLDRACWERTAVGMWVQQQGRH